MPREARSLSKQRLRTVIVGFGNVAAEMAKDRRMARYFKYATHGQVLANHPDFDWQAVVDKDEKALRRARDEWGIPHCTTTIERLIERFDPEIAVLTAPPEVWPNIVLRAPRLRAILAEKPLGVTNRQRRRFLDLCRERDIQVQVNYWRRGALGLRRLAAGGLAARIGHPQAIFATYGKGLYNNASHLVDFLRMLFGEIVAVRAVGEAKRAELSPFANDVELPFVATLASGSTAFIGALDFAKYREVGLDVWGDVGRLTILQEGLVVTHYARRANRGVRDAAEIASDEGRILPCPVERAFYDLYGNLAAALRGADRLWSSGESALRTENALAAVIRSARAGGVPVSP